VKLNDLYKLVVELTLPAPVSKPFMLSARDRDILATLLVREAGGDVDYVSSMAGVMNTVVNRARRDPSKFVAVAVQPQQFSCFNNIKTAQMMDALIQKTKQHSAYSSALSLVDSAVKGKLLDITKGSTHYYANKGTNKIKTPYWAEQNKETNQIGNHLYYKNIKFKKVK
jgi:spore germination cell wall hydrolase CwlJ-like protein